MPRVKCLSQRPSAKSLGWVEDVLMGFKTFFDPEILGHFDAYLNSNCQVKNRKKERKKREKEGRKG
jgi:hypothetical protein